MKIEFISFKIISIWHVFISIALNSIRFHYGPEGINFILCFISFYVLFYCFFAKRTIVGCSKDIRRVHIDLISLLIACVSPLL